MVTSEYSITQVGKEEISTAFELTELRQLYLREELDANNKHVVTEKTIPMVRNLALDKQKRVLVTGGAGFVGSHLVDRLMKMGHIVYCLDNFYTGHRRNVEHWIGHPNFQLIHHDVVNPYMVEVDQIFHLACPASPPHYQSNQVKTLKTGFMGTLNMLGLAKRVNARFLLASTSEVYGDPEVHPQKESYWGNVNPNGPRACYDEAKRVGETLTVAYSQQDNVDTRIVRIFNTFGPRMNPADGRVVSNFIIQALKGEPLTIYGDGEQTRSFQYVHDLVDGLLQVMESDYTMPVNLGNPHEFTIGDFAKMVKEKIQKDTEIVKLDPVVDDPQRRKPDISLAKKVADWQPRFSVDQGVNETIEYFKLVVPLK